MTCCRNTTNPSDHAPQTRSIDFVRSARSTDRSLPGKTAAPTASFATNTYAFELPTPTAPLDTPTLQPAAQTTETTLQTPTKTPTPQPIPTRAMPADFNWKDLPAQPEISANALAIYERGLAMGRNPKNISIVGDCQAIPYVFLGKYGIKQYTLDTDYYLEPMIAFYRASFAREGYAVRGGFTAAGVLSPVQADPKACQPGETPLECEWRIQNPSIAIINLETWLVDGTVDRYESYLRRIVEFSIQHGTLPILITKADMAESKVPVINPAMARIAYEYDIPIVNFWHAAQFLDNHGLDPSREGFHLSTAGYDLKQKLTLFTLYDIWKAERPDLRVSAQPTEPVPVTTTAQPETTTLPAVKFQCAANCLYFDLFTSSPRWVDAGGHPRGGHGIQDHRGTIKHATGAAGHPDLRRTGMDAGQRGIQFISGGQVHWRSQAAAG